MTVTTRVRPMGDEKGTAVDEIRPVPQIRQRRRPQ